MAFWRGRSKHAEGAASPGWEQESSLELLLGSRKDSTRVNAFLAAAPPSRFNCPEEAKTASPRLQVLPSRTEPQACTATAPLAFPSTRPTLQPQNGHSRGAGTGCIPSERGKRQAARAGEASCASHPEISIGRESEWL